MALKISPSSRLDPMVVGADVSYKVDMTSELGSNTVDTYTYKIYDENNVEVTDNFSGESVIANGIITFGVKGYAAGIYKLMFWVTCVEPLPDETTPYKFPFEMSVLIE